MQGWRRWLIALLLLAAGGLAAQAVIHSLFPFPYRAEVTDAAHANGLSPYLVAAVIRTESRFRPDATSRRGAVGLMQLLPDTASWAAARMGMTHFTPADLRNPSVNIAIGTWYLAELRREFHGNLILALAAYNGGRTNVRAWLESGAWDGKSADIKDIPFKETRSFVDRVMNNYRVYVWLYGGQ